MLAKIGRPVLVVLMLLFFVTAVSNVKEGQQEEGRQQLEDALRRTGCFIVHDAIHRDRNESAGAVAP